MTPLRTIAPASDTVLDPLLTGEHINQDYAPYKQYLNFLRITTTIEELRREFRNVHTHIFEDATLLAMVAKKNLLVGMTAEHMRAEAEKNPTRLIRQNKEWFSGFLRDADEALVSLESWTSILQDRTKVTASLENRKVIEKFLQRLQNDLESFIAGCVHMATSLACHSQEENCAVYMVSTPFALFSEEDREEFGQQAADLLSRGVFSKYPETFSAVGKHEDGVVIPTLMSVVDISRFMTFFKNFMSKLNDAASGKRSSRGATSFTRTHGTTNAQARILFQVPHDSAYEDFSLRIDLDPRRGVTLDIGCIRVQSALAHAQDLMDASLDDEIVMSYEHIINNEGALARVNDPTVEFPRETTHPYASIMLSKYLSPGEKAALVAACVLRASKNVTFDKNARSFSYHMRGELHRTTDTEFAAAAKALAGILR